MESCIYTGKVRHRRFEAAHNEFTYTLFMMYMDLAELPHLFDPHWLWSARGRAMAEFRRSDYHGPEGKSLDCAVRDTVERETGERPGGPIRLLAHLRYFGYIFNPVSFYYIFDSAGKNIDTILAEITNTPWGERRAHVLGSERNLATSKGRMRFQFRKDFHVSPFMNLDYDYDWRFTAPGKSLGVHMENRKAGRVTFDATMNLERRPLDSANLARVLLNYPAMTGKVIAAIYWQALKLKIKGVPYYPNPHREPIRKLHREEIPRYR